MSDTHTTASEKPAPAQRLSTPQSVQSRLRGVASLISGMSVQPAPRRPHEPMPYRWTLRRDVTVDIPASAGGARSRRIRLILELGSIPSIDEMARAGRMHMRKGGNGRLALEILERMISERVGDIDQRIKAAVDKFRLETYQLEPGLDSHERRKMYDRLTHQLHEILHVTTTAETAELDLIAELRAIRGKPAAKAVNRLISFDSFRERSGFDDFIGRFPIARAMGRTFKLFVGPTNSGKTHAAMRELCAVTTGIYLAPLRLLALEGREILDSLGVRGGMLTGEERDIPDDATHLSQTIETANFERPLDLAVIDEVQMLADRDRGWAWSQALIGIPAKQVLLCGSLEAIPLVHKALALTGESLEIVTFERKNELIAQNDPVGYDRIRKGDALIAFSRRDLFQIREKVVAMGHTVSTVYGALAPDVRRAEAARFRSGEADVLIATDAIGMGLNFGPLKRIVFASLTKFDGVGARALEDHEIRQIAGRAGRFGHAECGYVTTLEPLLPNHLAKALKSPPVAPPPDFRFPVSPDRRTIEIAAEETSLTDLTAILLALAERLTDETSPFRPSGFEDTIDLAKLLADVKMPIGDKFDFASCPLELKDWRNVTCLQNWARAHASHGYAVVPRPRAQESLQDMEGCVKRLTAYLWLARRFPDTFIDTAEVIEIRKQLNDNIEQDLISSAKKKVEKKSKRKNNWYPASPT